MKPNLSNRCAEKNISDSWGWRCFRCDNKNIFTCVSKTQKYFYMCFQGRRLSLHDPIPLAKVLCCQDHLYMWWGWWYYWWWWSCLYFWLWSLTFMPMTSSNQVSHLANAPSKAPFVPEYIPGNDCNDNKNHVDDDHDDDNVQNWSLVLALLYKGHHQWLD